MGGERLRGNNCPRPSGGSGENKDRQEELLAVILAHQPTNQPTTAKLGKIKGLAVFKKPSTKNLIG